MPPRDRPLDRSKGSTRSMMTAAGSGYPQDGMWLKQSLAMLEPTLHASDIARNGLPDVNTAAWPQPNTDLQSQFPPAVAAPISNRMQLHANHPDPPHPCTQMNQYAPGPPAMVPYGQGPAGMSAYAHAHMNPAAMMASSMWMAQMAQGAMSWCRPPTAYTSSFGAETGSSGAVASPVSTGDQELDNRIHGLARVMVSTGIPRKNMKRYKAKLLPIIHPCAYMISNEQAHGVRAGCRGSASF